MNVEKLERELFKLCITCKKQVMKIAAPEIGFIDGQARRWKGNRCPECIGEYKKVWARNNYGKNAQREKVRRALG